VYTSIISWNYPFRQQTQGLLFSKGSVRQCNKTLESVNIVMCSESHFAIVDQEPSCSTTRVPTDDEHLHFG
jgi:hypothetical protein